MRGSGADEQSVDGVVGLNLFNTELSPKRYRRGPEIPGGWGRGRLYLTPHYHHQNDSGIKMSSDGSLYILSLIVRDKVTRRCPQTITFEE